MLRLLSAMALIFLCSLNAFAAQAHQGPSHLGGSAVRWSDHRLTAELKNVPVKGLLKDLMESDGAGCQVNGDLQGTISLQIDNLTVEEAIFKIMRNRKYDFTMISAESESSHGQSVSVSELTIYQDGNEVRFVRVPKGERIAQPAPGSPVPPPATAPTPPPAEPPARNNLATGEMLEDLDREIKSLMDEMMAEEKISQEEYDEALQTFRGED